MTKEKELNGLGGWLILVGIGIILSPVKIITQVFPSYPEIFSSGSFAILTTPGSQAYNPFWAPIILGEIALNSGLVIAWIFIAFLFFTKKQAFTKWYVGILLFTLTFIFIDALATKLVLPDEPIFDAEVTKEFGRTLLVTLIWVPYMLISKRVKATFVN